MQTLRTRLTQAEQQLKSGPHSEKARLDAESLALFLLQKNRAWLLANLDQPAPPALNTQFDETLHRRHQGEPIQYITGTTEFFGLPFTVTPDVLIPRPETEHLVEEVLCLAKSFPETIEIADIGTGSGAIAVALAHALPKASITATDISAAALTIARQNATRNQVAGRIEFLQGDLLAPLAGRNFQIIASNPPYVPASDLQLLSVEVRDYEPHLALFAAEDGLLVYQRLIPQARAFLLPDGYLVLELGYGQQSAVACLFASSSYAKVQFVQDYQRIPRTAIARHS